MTSLQLGLIAAGVLLVIGVIIYNWWQERRVRARLESTFSNLGKTEQRVAPAAERVEPTLNRRDSTDEPMLTRAGAAEATSPSRVAIDDVEDQGFELPVKVQARMAATEGRTDVTPDFTSDDEADAEPLRAPAVERLVHDDKHGAQPDPDIECIVALQPAKPVPVDVMAPALQARLGKRLRWFGRRGVSMPW